MTRDPMLGLVYFLSRQFRVRHFDAESFLNLGQPAFDQIRDGDGLAACLTQARKLGRKSGPIQEDAAMLHDSGPITPLGAAGDLVVATENVTTRSALKA